jgi:arginyl-tRNA synthetase
MSLTDRVRNAITAALDVMVRAGEIPASAVDGSGWVVERPKRADHGDLATNVAMALSKRAGKPPRALAQGLVAALAGDEVIAAAEVAGPGFVNLRLRPWVFQDVVAEILRQGSGWGRAPAATGERVNLEFVSANPTGPVTVASGRNAVLGDSVARLLEAKGHRVTREYYINDRGNQVRVFAESVRADCRGR